MHSALSLVQSSYQKHVHAASFHIQNGENITFILSLTFQIYMDARVPKGEKHTGKKPMFFHTLWQSGSLWKMYAVVF